MPDETLQQRALEAFWRQATSGNAPTVTRTQLQAIAADAAARLVDGTTVVEVTLEGGLTRSVTNCSPGAVLAAANQILAETDTGNVLGGPLDPRNRFLDFSGGRIET